MCAVCKMGIKFGLTKSTNTTVAPSISMNYMFIN